MKREVQKRLAVSALRKLEHFNGNKYCGNITTTEILALKDEFGSSDVQYGNYSFKYTNALTVDKPAGIVHSTYVYVTLAGQALVLKKDL